MVVVVKRMGSGFGEGVTELGGSMSGLYGVELGVLGRIGLSVLKRIGLRMSGVLRVPVAPQPIVSIAPLLDFETFQIRTFDIFWVSPVRKYNTPARNLVSTGS